MSKHALVVIDIQNDYFPDGKWPLYQIEQAAANARQVLNWFRQQALSVVHVYHEFETTEAPFFVPGSKGAEIHPDMAPVDGEHTVLKHKVNAFLNTELHELLQQQQVEEITLIGAMSHMCIDGAARAAADLGYKVNVVQDACASRDLELNGKVVPAEQVHTAYMSALGFAYAELKFAEDYQ